MNSAAIHTSRSGLWRLRNGKHGRSVQEQEVREDAHFYRSQTIAIVRHFFEISTQIGRLPSIMGREFFRGRVSHHAIPSFEEQAVFVHDVEHALGKLSERDFEVIALLGLFRYTVEEAAMLLGRSRNTAGRRYADALDRLAELFLEARIVRRDRVDRHVHCSVEKRPAPMLPAKKPPQSAAPSADHFIAEVSPGYSFTPRAYRK